MKKILLTIIGIGTLFGGVVLAAPTTTYQPNIFPSSTTYPFWIGTSTNPWTGINVRQICLTADSCRTTWPTGSGGSGNVGTSTVNYFAIYSSSTIVTGTPLMQLSNGAITITTNTILATTTATALTITSATTTNLYVSSLANIVQLGVNSSSPNAQLAIQGTGTLNPFTIVSSSGSQLLSLRTNGIFVGDTDDVHLELSSVNGTHLGYGSGGNHTNFVLTDGVMQFIANTVEVGRWSTSNFLIGTTTPNARLYIQGGGNNPFEIVSSTAAASSMFTVLTNGRVGINSSTPSTFLGVQGNVEVVGIITSTKAALTGTGNTTLKFGLGTGGYTNGVVEVGAVGTHGVVITTNDSGSWAFLGKNTVSNNEILFGGPDVVDFRKTAGSQGTFIIKSTGFVGIGTSSPTYGFSVNADSYFIGSLMIPWSGTLLTTTTGKIGIDVTSGQLRFNNGTATSTIVEYHPGGFTIASSSLVLTASNTIPIGFAMNNQTWGSYGCFTTSTGGTLATGTVRFGNGVATWMTAIQATSSKAGVLTPITTVSSNNTFSAGAQRWVQIGNIVGTFDYISCSYKYTFDAD